MVRDNPDLQKQVTRIACPTCGQSATGGAINHSPGCQDTGRVVPQPTVIRGDINPTIKKEA